MWVSFCLIVTLFNLFRIDTSYASEYNLNTEHVPSLSKAFEEPSQISFLSMELNDETFFLLAYKLVAIQMAASNLILQVKNRRTFQWPPPSKILIALSKLLQDKTRSDIESEIWEAQNVLKLMITSKPSDIRKMSKKILGEKVNLDIVAFSKWLVDTQHFKLNGVKTADAYLIAYYFLKFYWFLLLPSKNGWQSEVMKRLLGDVKRELEKQVFLTDNFEGLYERFIKDTKKTTIKTPLVLTLTIILFVLLAIIWNRTRNKKNEAVRSRKP